MLREPPSRALGFDLVHVQPDIVVPGEVMHGCFVRWYRKHLCKGFVVSVIPGRANASKVQPQERRSRNGTHSSSLTALLPDAVMSPRKITWCGLKCIAKCQLFLRCKSNNKWSKAVRNEKIHDGAMAGFLIWVSETTNICEECLLCRKGYDLDLCSPGSRRENQRTHRYFEMFLRPPAILEAQVKEPDLTPDDGQTPKNDESLLDNLGTCDPRH